MSNQSEPQHSLTISREVAMKLYDSYKAHKNITTHQPFPLGAGGVMKFWTKNLSFVANGATYIVTVKKDGKQSALIELEKFLGEEA